MPAYLYLPGSQEALEVLVLHPFHSAPALHHFHELLDRQLDQGPLGTQGYQYQVGQHHPYFLQQNDIRTESQNQALYTIMFFFLLSLGPCISKDPLTVN